MTRYSRLAWMPRWSAPIAWLGAAILFGLWVDPRNFAWWIGAYALAILSHLAILHHARASEGDPFRAPHPPRRFPPRRSLTFSTLLLLLTSPALAQVPGSPKPKQDQQENYNGFTLFRTYCASCHGIAAKGDGPLAEHLRFHPSDLTLLARRNRGSGTATK